MCTGTKANIIITVPIAISYRQSISYPVGVMIFASVVGTIDDEVVVPVREYKMEKLIKHVSQRLIDSMNFKNENMKSEC